MRVLAPSVVHRFRIVNTHPSLLPDFPGAHAIRDVLAAAVPTTGVTVHWVDDGVDTGPVLAQQPVPVRPGDDEDSLRDRIQAVEKPLYVATIRRLLKELPEMSRIPVRRALVSVSDKTGVAELARQLHAAGVELVSTGSTAARIAEAGVPVTAVEDVTGFPEILDGRVKTLHPHVHAGLLADPRDPAHTATLDEREIEPFQLLVGNLYPFRQALAAGVRGDELVEQIDIGGPAMIRAAAKNHAGVAVVVDPGGYGEALEAVRSGGFDDDQRAPAGRGRVRAHRRVRHGDRDLDGQASSRRTRSGGPGTPGSRWSAPRCCATARTRTSGPRSTSTRRVAGGLASARQLHGKEMSFNNYVDADAAYRMVSDFVDPAVAVVKHTNPCGIAVGSPDAADPVADAHRKANACDPQSAFGGVIAVNRPVTVAMAEQVAEVFTEVLVAPGFLEGSLDVLTAKKSLRLLVVAGPRPAGVEFREISGGVLAQQADRLDAPGRRRGGLAADRRRAGGRAHAGRPALRLAGDPVGEVQRDPAGPRPGHRRGRDGPGQPGGRGPAGGAAGRRPGGRRRWRRRTRSSRSRTGWRCSPRPGVRAVVEPGGSVRDPEVIAAAEAAGISLYLTGTRHFAH